MEPRADHCDVDVVISTFGGSDRIAEAIESLLRSTHKRFTLWILDQNADDRTQAQVQRYCDDQRIQYRRVPLRGISATRNHGASLGRAPIILFTNDDCRADPDWIGRLAGELSDPGVWLASGRILPDERGRPATEGDWQVLAVMPHDRREAFVGSRRSLNYIHGNNFGLRRDAFERLRGFDEQLGVGRPLRSADERDLAYRVALSGGGAVYSPDALVLHDHWQDGSAIEKNFESYAIGIAAMVMKYVRCGKLQSLVLLAQWIKEFCVVWLIKGLADRRQRRYARIALRQWKFLGLGLLQGATYPIDKRYMVFAPEQMSASAVPLEKSRTAA